ncbi:hypothetical protein HOLleu_01795 [Holothuria leucospilota]|uniref:Uncharacterized protein n=1 Tax=Holothuria leucospilota TaxID=206669 RepID=A0A9Q1CPT8_HOLLE|nr:hypothetical protein HOLleu_01795 [Holothuria leucospilota]
MTLTKVVRSRYNRQPAMEVTKMTILMVCAILGVCNAQNVSITPIPSVEAKRSTSAAESTTNVPTNPSTESKRTTSIVLSKAAAKTSPRAEAGRSTSAAKSTTNVTPNPSTELKRTTSIVLSTAAAKTSPRAEREKSTSAAKSTTNVTTNPTTAAATTSPRAGKNVSKNKGLMSRHNGSSYKPVAQAWLREAPYSKFLPLEFKNY